MRTVHKYPLVAPGLTTIPTDATSKIVYIGQDGSGLVCAWVETDLSRPTSRNLHLHTIPTGGQVPAQSRHVGSVVTVNGLAWHVYQLA